jgi:hypothetical protein
MRKIGNTTTTGTIGRKEKRLRVLKDSCYPSGDSAMKRRRNMSLPLLGILNIRIYLLFLWVAMISPNKKLVRSSSGHSKTSPSQNISTKAYQLV